MKGKGRPLYFLTVVIGGWIGARTALLWPVQEIAPALIGAVAPAAAAEPARKGMAHPRRIVPVTHRLAAAPAPSSLLARPSATAPLAAKPASGSPPARFEPPAAAVASPPDPLPAGSDPPPVFRTSPRSRWSGSAWAILRPDGRATPFVSQLGGSQAGGRLAYAIDGARRLALYARVSTAIDSPQREGAVGVDWRPTRLPIHLIAERRIGIEGVRSGTAIGAVGGIGPTPIAGPVRIEGYAQGGMIVRERAEGFVDGSLRFTLPVATRLDLGLGVWGGAQQGASRADVGPTIGLSLPVAGRGVRLSADWRQRVAGDARPGSGPAVSLGFDF